MYTSGTSTTKYTYVSVYVYLSNLLLVAACDADTKSDIRKIYVYIFPGVYNLSICNFNQSKNVFLNFHETVYMSIVQFHSVFFLYSFINLIQFRCADFAIKTIFTL